MGLVLWMRIVGALYLFLFVAASILRLPIRAEGPPGVLERASAGDATARFVVDTWFTFGLDFAVIGTALIVASRAAEQAGVLVWTVLGIEAVRGIGVNLYKIARGYQRTPMLVWIVIHAVIIATGLRALGRI